MQIHIRKIIADALRIQGIQVDEQRLEEHLLNQMKLKLLEGYKIRFKNMMILELRDTPSRKLRNPRTGQQVITKDKKRLKMKTSYKYRSTL